MSIASECVISVKSTELAQADPKITESIQDECSIADLVISDQGIEIDSSPP